MRLGIEPDKTSETQMAAISPHRLLTRNSSFLRKHSEVSLNAKAFYSLCWKSLHRYKLFNNNHADNL